MPRSLWPSADFNPQGPRGPRLVAHEVFAIIFDISIHKALAGLDMGCPPCIKTVRYFNPQGPRGPRPYHHTCAAGPGHFNPQGPRGPRRLKLLEDEECRKFQSTRPSRASTLIPQCFRKPSANFNPQGPRGPRPKSGKFLTNVNAFQSTRPSRASTAKLSNNPSTSP